MTSAAAPKAAAIPRSAAELLIWPAADPVVGGVSMAVCALAAFTFLIISRLVDSFPSMHLAQVAGAVTIVAALLLPRRAGAGLLDSADVRAVLALFGVAAIGAPLSIWRGGSFAHLVNVFAKAVLFFLLVVHCVRSVREARIAVWSLLLAVFVLELGVVFMGAERLSGTYDRNDIAFVVACTLPLSGMLFADGAGAGKWLAGAIALLAAPTMVATQSRTGFVCLLVVGAVVVLRATRGRAMLRIGVVVAALGIAIPFAPASYWERIATLWGEAPRHATRENYDAAGFEAARGRIWRNGLTILAEHPLLGVGAGVFEVAEGRVHHGRGKWTTAHNSFLQVAVELGLVGLALFVYLIYRAWRNARDFAREAVRMPALVGDAWLGHALEISIYGYMLAGSALSQGYSYLLYWLLGMAVAARRLATESAAAAEPITVQSEVLESTSRIRPARGRIVGGR
ncbi:MAG: hypothetical protein QOD06_2579 [Candidatus Binatota bacterium]|nr:hypothetical protein [Candidatus Binatota bacterium]